MGRAPRRQCRLAHFSGGVDRPYGNKATVREIPTHRAALRDSPRIFSRRYFPTLAKRRPTGGGNSCATMLPSPRQSRRDEQRKKTDHGEPIRHGATLAASPWFFNRRCSLPMRKTSELPNAVPPWASLLRSLLGVAFPFRRNGGQVRQRSWATTLFPKRRLRCCSAGVDPIGFGETNIGEDAAPRGHFGSIGVPCSPAGLPVQGGEKRRSPTN